MSSLIRIQAVNLYNSIFAGNTGGDCIGGLNNGETAIIIQDGSCDAKISSDPLLGAQTLSNPKMDRLPYHTAACLAVIAIDSAGQPRMCSGYVDQIGTERPQGAGCDIGVIEYVSDD